jgi:hypothetical protein
MITPGRRLLVAGDVGCVLLLDMMVRLLCCSCSGTETQSVVIMTGCFVIMIAFEVPRCRVPTAELVSSRSGRRPPSVSELAARNCSSSR